MPKYLIERELPGAGAMSPQELQQVAMKSCEVLKGDIGEGYHWLHSYVAGDRIYCVHVAPDEEAVREHARRGQFPLTRIMEVDTIIDASTGEDAQA